MARIKLFDPSELAAVTFGQLCDMVTAWAPLDAAIETAKAEKDRRKAEFDRENDERYKIETSGIASDHASGLAQISLVMSRHPEWFEGVGCKERHTDNAVFGYRKKADAVTVSDKDLLKDYSDANNLKLYNIELKPIMAAVKRQLKDVPEIPGVRVTRGVPEPFAGAIMRNLDESRKG